MIEPSGFEYNTDETISGNFHRFVKECTRLYDHDRNPFATTKPEFDAMESRVDGSNPPILVVNVDCDRSIERVKEVAMATFDFLACNFDEIVTAMRIEVYPDVAFIRG